MRYVFHDAVHRPRKIELIFIVHGDTNEQFSVPCRRSNVLSQLIALEHKIVWITSDRSVPHVGKFKIIPPGQKTMEYGWYLALKNELSIDQSDLLLRHLGLSGTASLLTA